ncbi:MazG nucleotide pyrophosphohydrolase domain-containing protein [Corynebacterium halotolerans]|uniref:Hypothatical protein n=1 Tax=Corynebacterium halotolerans YIM 70093 = DSM 44683 TaxID=1121362 RepID=M1MW87_9CORY|nr:MazG nucleotide pyrophosphohydrolase domain-containing protein [Corynebacterium halotolerans]AGF71974.1 hypothatical protein [Corynebacterium halotolerans YIM 70093 = DSM 44683]
MTVLLLDDRWPSMIPLEAYGRLAGPVAYTDEVPVNVRWNFGDLVRPDGPGVLVSTNERDPRVVERVDAGDDVIAAPSRKDPVRDALHAMTRARSMGEWEASQTHESLLPYLTEETGEFAQAVGEWGETGDEAQLCRELGDVLLQVFFHAELASRRGAFDFSDVAGSFVAKLRSRAPYLFDGSTGMVSEQEQERLWREGKARERRIEEAGGRHAAP